MFGLRSGANSIKMLRLDGSALSSPHRIESKALCQRPSSRNTWPQLQCKVGMHPLAVRSEPVVPG
ncbi:hypothetical protein CERZMDRAFT_90369 [Cercospora zeae-maydis SCOH1-5]|uniref:Uncharacterized protein n=1 Tax=Cercospora zeae-maydis SCOH1-5 TaxID=717836 RepID=A0A6A6FKU1_9PEZI|nr:hypothetical protein CERZMDRAFT_90369 [Cercospora zeae-maydis SCOH1-5]